MVASKFNIGGNTHCVATKNKVDAISGQTKRVDLLDLSRVQKGKLLRSV